MFLALLTAALPRIKHCQFGHCCPAVINDGNQADGGESADSSGGTARNGAVTCLNGNGEKSERTKKGGGRACRRYRPAKATARTTQAAKESLRQPVSAAARKRSLQTNGQNLTGSHGS